MTTTGTEFTWHSGQPIHKEDKGSFQGECLDEQVDRIVGKDTTLDDLLSELPGEIPFSPTQNMRLSIQKCGSKKFNNLSWQVGYYIYKDPGKRDFDEVPVEYENQPDLRLALYNLIQKINKTRETAEKNGKK